MKTLFHSVLSIALMAHGLTLTTRAEQPWSVTPTPPVQTAGTNLPATPPSPLAPPPRPAVTPVAPVAANVPLPTGILAFDADQKDYLAKTGEANASFVFNVTNLSPAEVTITYVQTSCGCTTAKIQVPLKIAPGRAAEIPINMSLLGKSSPILKSVIIHTDQGQKMLLVKTTIQPPAPDPAALALERERNRLVAQTNRQAVFQGDCARCHGAPTIGKVGKDLFTAACGICHEAPQRAPMVADLQHLKTPPPADFWRTTIVNGKPKTLMPAFAPAQGGPLSDAQINSLVTYLVKDFPHSQTNAVSHASTR